MIKKIFKKHWLLIIILLLASFLRLYKIDGYMEFLGDQGRDVYIIRDFLKNGNLFFIGPQTSIGNMYLGPWFYYLITPALFLSNYNPVGPAVFIALLNIFTVYCIYFVSQKWFSKTVGLFASFLFAISPVVIKYSNFIWNPNIMPLFSLLFVYFFFEAFFAQKFKYFIYASLSFIMVINSHYIGLALLPFCGLFWLFNLIKFIKIKSKNIKPFIKYTVLAILIFIFSLTPQILFDIKHNSQNFNALMTFFTQRETTVNIKPYKAIPVIPSLFAQINTRLLAGKNEFFGLVITLIISILILPIILKYKKQNSGFWVIFFWVLSGLGALALYKQHIYDHYFSFLFPAIFILIAFIINRFKLLGIPLLTIIVYLSITNSPLKEAPNYQLRHSLNIAESINQNLPQPVQKYNISMLASYNDFRAQAPRYFVNQSNLLSLEEYQSAQTLFVIVDDPSKWPQGIDSDIWEINIFKENSAFTSTNLTSSDGTKIIKLSKN